MCLELTYGLANYLYRQLKNARSVAPKMIVQFHGLCALYGKEKVEQWSKLSTKAEFKKGEWRSVYRYCDSAGMSTNFNICLIFVSMKRSA